MSLSVPVRGDGQEKWVTITYKWTVDGLEKQLIDIYDMKRCSLYVDNELLDDDYVFVVDSELEVRFDKVKEGRSIVNDSMKVDSLKNLIEREDFIKALVNSKHVDIKDTHDDTSLYWASMKGFNNVVQTLISAGADSNVRNKIGNTPLHVASKEGHNNVVRILVSSGVDINSKNKYGNTPLYWASKKGRDDVVRTLIENGADVNIKNENDYTALDKALENGHDYVAQMLINAGAYNSAVLDDINYDVIRILMDAGVNFSTLLDNGNYDGADINFSTLLDNGNYDVIRTLMDVDADNSTVSDN